MGHVDQLAAGTLLPAACLDRHAEEWLSATIEYEEGSWADEDPKPASAVKPETCDFPIFLSYARVDGQPARDFRDRLRNAGIDVWMEILITSCPESTG